MKVLFFGNRKKFIKDINKHKDCIIDMYNDYIYLKDNRDYTDGYLDGIKCVLHKIGHYEQLELNKIR